jgi:hypothetical protein
MDKETNILQHIITHCENIMQAKNRFGNSFDVFSPRNGSCGGIVTSVKNPKLYSRVNF